MRKDLIQKYKNAAKLHGEGTLDGDSGKTNSAHGLLTEIYLEMKTKDLLEDLRTLLKDANSSVRSWAALHLLPIYENESLSVLQDVSKEKSLVGFSAVATLKEWKSGRLKI